MLLSASVSLMVRYTGKLSMTPSPRSKHHAPCQGISCAGAFFVIPTRRVIIMTNRPTVLALVIGSSIFAGSPDAATGTQNEALPARVDRYGDPLPEGAAARLGSLRFWQSSHVGFTEDSKKLMSVLKDQVGNDLRFWDVATRQNDRAASSQEP
jgi:hypothetical protein